MDTAALIAYIRKASSPLPVLETGETARLDPSGEIGSVVFDIYGTLLISGSGDISLARSENRTPALVEALCEAGYSVPGSPDWDASRDLLAQVEEHRRERAGTGVTFPEVRIEEVWADFLKEACAAGHVAGEGDLPLAIIAYECRVNPCWPMPALEEILAALADRGLPLGIVSNAQFYTPLYFPALTGKTLPEWTFREPLSIWSYRERMGKPSTKLYQRLAHNLLQFGIEPARTLYIGNDLLNDVLPARETGFQTALFAGDARSLRWRREDPRCHKIQPNNVLTRLDQVLQLLS
mgnify:CR=1 FL=1